MANIPFETTKYTLPEIPTRQVRYTVLRNACLDLPSGNVIWGGLSQKPITRKGANQFILGAIMDYQMSADFIWAKAKWIAEEYFKGSENIWEEIGKFSEEDWYRFCKDNSVHRFPAVYKRILRIGKQIEVEYCGDVRNIWKGISNERLRNRLLDMGFGPQITNMIMGALFDEGIITGTLDIKADTHATRVIGRAIEGREISPEEAVNIAREIYPENPWKLDVTLFRIGQRLCTKSEVFCKSCPIKPGCFFYHDEVVGIGNILPKDDECVSFEYLKKLYARVGWSDGNLLLADSILRKLGKTDSTDFAILRAYIRESKRMETLVFCEIKGLNCCYSIGKDDPEEIEIASQGGNELQIRIVSNPTDKIKLLKVYSDESQVFTSEASESKIERLIAFVLNALK